MGRKGVKLSAILQHSTSALKKEREREREYDENVLLKNCFKIREIHIWLSPERHRERESLGERELILFYALEPEKLTFDYTWNNSISSHRADSAYMISINIQIIVGN